MVINYIKYRITEFLYGVTKIPINKDALVLEVASGARPYWRSNVLLDKFVLDNSERSGDVTVDRDFVVSDVNKLPFKDKVFDFVIARHILEHLPEPENFLKELERVAKAGYIETPSSISEDMGGWDCHLWCVDVVDNKLKMMSKSKEPNSQLKKIPQIFGVKAWESFISKHRSVFYTSYFWKDRIDFNIVNNGLIKKDLESTDTTFNIEQMRQYFWDRCSIKRKIKILIHKLRRSLFSKSKTYDLVDLLSCTKCKGGGGVNKFGGHLVCKECGNEFKCIDGVPIML